MMQGNELFPRGQHVVGGRFRPRTPDRRRGDGFADACRDFCQSAPGQFAHDRFAIGWPVMSEDIEQRRLEVARERVAKLKPGQFLEMIVQQPGIVDRGLQD